MDTPVDPPRIVLEGRESCPNAEQARTFLHEALAAASAPTPGWTVLMRVEQSASHALRAEGDIADAAGRSIAHRVLSGAATDCGGLARAMGVWAALVLDVEMSHTRPPSPATPVRGDAAAPASASTGSPAPAAAERVLPAPSPMGVATPPTSAAGAGLSPGLAEAESPTLAPTAPATRAGPSTTTAASGGASAYDAVPRDRSPWPPAIADSPPPTTSSFATDGQARGESAALGRRDEHRTLEIGAGTLLMAGTGSNAILGMTAYVGIEVAPGLFVRPALAGGESLAPLGGQGNANALWFAARTDACWRTPGTYPRNRGMVLDLCGGVDAGATRFAGAPSGYSGTGAPPTTSELPVVALGPGLNLQGDLGNDLAVAIRGVAGVNAVRTSFTDTSGATVKVPWFSGRLEVALSWRAR
ncbi:MAG TPA: hypothetical protein VEK07_01730 [Polyangiaceae bacterium]|nr:hypothetical protein [Polyangiaceae bacterium]